MKFEILVRKSGRCGIILRDIGFNKDHLFKYFSTRDFENPMSLIEHKICLTRAGKYINEDLFKGNNPKRDYVLWLRPRDSDPFNGKAKIEDCLKTWYKYSQFFTLFLGGPHFLDLKTSKVITADIDLKKINKSGTNTSRAIKLLELVNRLFKNRFIDYYDY